MYNNKTNIILTISALLVLLLVTISATYAYFNSNVQDSNALNVGIEASSAPTFTAYTLDQITLDVKSNDLFTPSTTASKSDTGQVVASLASGKNGDQVFCTYNIELVWDSTDQYIAPVGTLDNTYKYEISLKGNQVVSGDTTGHSYTVTTLNETNLTNFVWEGAEGAVGRKTNVVTGAEIYSRSTTATTATWTFTLNFYTLPTDQSDLMGKNYSAHLGVTNVVC